MSRLVFTLIGAAVGFGLFVGLVLVPALYYGGFAALLLDGSLADAPLRAASGLRVLAASGSLGGAFGAGCLCTLAGAAAGAAASLAFNMKPLRPTNQDPRV